MCVIAHVPHEAVRKIGGIGAVLEGLITAAPYQARVRRTLLIGPITAEDDEEQLERVGKVAYSSRSGIRDTPLSPTMGSRCRRVRRRCRLGWRTVGDGTRVEVLLVSPVTPGGRHDAALKRRLYDVHGLQSDRYEGDPDFALFIGIVSPVLALLDRWLRSTAEPCFLLAHEYMGLPTALAVPDESALQTIFYAHEVSTVRNIVEAAPGHDSMFYSVMNLAASDGQSVEDIFGDQSTHSRHALVARAHACDAIFAVGDMTERELRFLSPSFRNYPIDLVYNGVPCEPIEMEQKERSRRKLQDYGEALLGYRPDFVFTHVTRPVKSKGYWRDLQVLTGLDEAFRKDGRKGVLFVVSTAVGSREATQVEEMVSSYGWPVHHEVGFPDLVGSEVDYWRAISEFNAYAESIRAVLVNQFGWDRASCGPAMPDDMTFADLRRGSDVEFGLSVYEPFGIAQVEPLGAGTICAVSSVCGCVSAVEAAGGQEPNLMVADYTAERSSIAEAIGMTSAEREGVEWKCSRALADRLYAALPETDTELAALITTGQSVAAAMTWDQVCLRLFFPALQRLSDSRTK